MVCVCVCVCMCTFVCVFNEIMSYVNSEVLFMILTCADRQNILFYLLAPKRQRLEDEFMGGREGVSSALVCLSPNACCVLVCVRDTLLMYQMGSIILGLKGMARCTRQCWC